MIYPEMCWLKIIIKQGQIRKHFIKYIERYGYGYNHVRLLQSTTR